MGKGCFTVYSEQIYEMFITKKNRLPLTKHEYKYLRYLSHCAKNLYNAALYNIKENYKETGKHTGYNQNYKALKEHKDYKSLQSDIAQQTIRILDQNYQSYFGLLKMQKLGLYDKPVHPPKYLEKDGHFILQCTIRSRNKATEKHLRIVPKKSDQEKFKIKHIKIERPEYTKGKILKQVRIIPKCNAKYFEIEWIYEELPEYTMVDNDRTISLDPGVSNFMTLVDNVSGHSIILDGKEMKSLNRNANKRSGKMQPGSMNKHKMFYKRERILNNSLNQYVNLIIQYCMLNNVGNIVMGEGYLAQENSNIGKTNNQNFVNMPYGKFIQKLKGKCEFYSIDFETVEESYTSKCDHLAFESMEHHSKYLGKRVKRGLFKSSTGVLLNSDVNGALGILLKSKHETDVNRLVSSGRLTRPRRITLDDIQKYSSIRLVKQLNYPSHRGLPGGM